jgi:G3E family GTPase
LVSREKLALLEIWLEDVSPNAVRLNTSGGVVPVQMIFGEKIKGNRFSDKADDETNRTEDSNYSHHNHQFKSVALYNSKKLNRKTFEIWCEALPPSVIRGKGILYFDDTPENSWVWQKVGKKYSIKKFLVNNSNSELVLIGTPEMPSPQELELPDGLMTIAEGV